jgi:hypothetical protein
MGTITTLGDVPYSALDITGNNLAPTYDAQAAVYANRQFY